MKKYILRSTMLCIFPVLFSCLKQSKTSTDDTYRYVNVKTARVIRTDIVAYATFNGISQFQKKEDIRSSVTGYVDYLPFKIGDRIKKGQVFALVNTKEQNALREAAKIDTTLQILASPIKVINNATGVITAVAIQSGDYISEGEVLATVVQPNSLVIQMNVPYGYHDRLKAGMPCKILTPSGQLLDAKITDRLPLIDPLTQSQAFILKLNNDDLPENLNVQVKIQDKEHKAVLCVPLEALQSDELLTDFWVMKVLDDTLAVKQKVIPLIRNDSLVEIASESLEEDDQVVTKGSYQLQDSTSIRVQSDKLP